MDWDSTRAVFVRYRTGDVAATEELFRGLTGPLERYFAVRTGSPEDARDLAQATLLKIHFGRDRFDPERSLKTWVFTIASRNLIDVWRGARAREARALEEGADVDELASPVASHGEILEYNDALSHALAELKPIERTLVYLCGVERMSIAEAAETVSLSEAAAKARVHRAYARLRTLLADADPGADPRDHRPGGARGRA